MIIVFQGLFFFLLSKGSSLDSSEKSLGGTLLSVFKLPDFLTEE